VAVRVLCAEDEEKARLLARSFWLICLSVHHQFAQGQYSYAPDLSEASCYSFSSSQLAYMREHALMMITGTPAQVKTQLEDLAERYQTDELLILTICPDREARRQSYRLLASAFELIPFHGSYYCS
jgi:alkanesulfonate monooxygenase SsuD/methylene tetrahydromethanopterin reductase-like flavin-dependent oxidoreductase (luciferase family)